MDAEIGPIAEAEPERPTLASEDPASRDPEIINSQIQDNAEPPTPEQLPHQLLNRKVEPPKITRLMTGVINMIAGTSAFPVMLLPSDAKRTRLTIRVQSATPADYVLVADDAGKVQSQMSAAPCYQAVPMTLDDHTGPIWIALPTVFVGPMVVSFYAVTA
jgi:hypothetical protein